jgi:hypothetical protein
MPPTGTGGRTTGGWAFDGQPEHARRFRICAVRATLNERCACISPGSVVDTRRHESQVILKITRRDDEPDDGICARQPKRNENGADDDAE